MMNKIIYVFFACLFSFSVRAAEINVSLDKNVMSEGDTLYLTIEYTGNDNGKPDLSSLQQDFKIVSNSSSSQISIINGEIAQAKKWTLGLLPLKTGKITIKPIRLGNTLSDYNEVEVKEMTNVAYVPDSRENTNSPYFQIERSYTPESPYIQQQLTFFVTLYDSIGLQNGTISFDNSADKNWIITPLSDRPHIKQSVINGKQMNVLTYPFAAFPQKSGEIALPQVMFDGYYIKNTSFDFPDFGDSLLTFGLNLRNAFGQKVPVKMKTNSELITVKPIPNGKNSLRWLPLKDLKIESSWNNKDTFKVGEAYSRTINITAIGIQASMLPQLTIPSSAEFKQYPEKPVTTESVIKGQLVTQASMNIVYIPQSSGTFTLPPVEIEWFNVDNGNFEKAVIEEEKITVSGSPNTFKDTVSNDTDVTTTPSQTQTDDSNKTSTLQTEKTNYFSTIPVWMLFFLGGILFIFIISRVKKPNKRKVLANSVIQNIRRADYRSAKAAIIEWAKHTYGQDTIKNFDSIADTIKDSDFTEQLSLLNALLYSNSNTPFNRTKFIETFKKADKMRKKIKKTEEVLPKLYD